MHEVDGEQHADVSGGFTGLQEKKLDDAGSKIVH
jgi:hypothetical protein